MSNKFTRLTIDFMHDERDHIEMLDYLVQLNETIEEEAEYIGYFKVVSSTMTKVELHEVGPAFSILQPPTDKRADIMTADSSDIEEDDDELTDDLVGMDELPE
jgi:hypothetical protein